MITANQLIRKVTELAVKDPNYIYMSNRKDKICVYLPCKDAPACIFGQAFIELDVDLREHSSFDEGLTISQLLNKLNVDVSREQEHWMMNIQGWQDMQRRWGDCLASSMENYPNVIKAALTEE